MRFSRARPVLAFACLILAGCQGALSTTDSFERGRSGIGVLLMPLDLQLAEVSTGGLQLPNAAWTARAEEHVMKALSGFMAARKARLIAYAPPPGQKAARDHLQLVKLHEAVGKSILRHHFTRRSRLPTKSDRFEWSMGPDARRLGRRTNADYALFVYIRDSYTSLGRVFQVALTFIRFGFLVPAGRLFGVASLVDLRSGTIVWFNRISRDQGDLRQAASAAESIEVLLDGFPK